MSLQLLPVEEDDVLAFSKVVFKAFDDDLMHLMYPDGAGIEHIEWYASKLRHDLATKGSVSRLNKVVDSALPDSDSYRKIICIAKWHFYANERTEAELDKQDAEDENFGTPPGVNTELMDAFHGAMSRNRRKVWAGKPYVLLQLLGTLPNHHKRGAGAQQLKWGLTAADALGLPVWLEATPAGKPLYERYGFVVVDEVDFDPQKWGLSDGYRTMNMLRPVKGQSTG